MNQTIMTRSGTAGSGTSVAGMRIAPRRDAPIGIEIRLLSACEALRQDWAELSARSLEYNPFFEPDFLLAAAQHLVAFREAHVLLAWQGEAADPGRRLVGLIPCFPRNGLFVPDQLIGLSDPRLLNGAPLLDAAQAQAVMTAVLTLSRGWDLRGRGLLLRRLDLDGPLVGPILRAADQLGLSATLHPAQPSPGTPDPVADYDALARQGKLVLAEARSRSEIRDHVELLLAMEASGPLGREGRATLQNTREVGFLRAMTRGLARSRQCRVALLLLDGQPIAGALVLGRGRRGWLYLSSRDERFMVHAPERVLLAMMRQAAPSRIVIERDRTGSAEQDGINPGELRLMPRAALKPRDLASRAGAALRRGFRLRHAERAG